MKKRLKNTRWSGAKRLRIFFKDKIKHIETAKALEEIRAET